MTSQQELHLLAVFLIVQDPLGIIWWWTH